jgi:hypothetical protein
MFWWMDKIIGLLISSLTLISILNFECLNDVTAGPFWLNIIWGARHRRWDTVRAKCNELFFSYSSDAEQKKNLTPPPGLCQREWLLMKLLKEYECTLCYPTAKLLPKNTVLSKIACSVLFCKTFANTFSLIRIFIITGPQSLICNFSSNFNSWILNSLNLILNFNFTFNF